MRKALNENPAVQAGMVLILVIVFAFLFFTRIMGGEEASPPSDTAATPAAGVPAGGVTPVPEGSAAAPAGAATAGADAAAAAAASGEFVAGKGLPQEVVSAYADGKAVVLLIIRKQGIVDQKISDVVNRLRSRGDVAVFITHAKSIARYSRITNGVNVEHTPALVIVRPRKLTQGGPPLASVSYGFRGPESVEQAVRDAFYDGPSNIPYYPEQRKARSQK